MITEFVIPVILAFGLSVLFTPLMQRIAHRLSIVARPNPIVQTHTSSIPYFGGGAVYLAFIIGLFASGVTSKNMAFALCSGLMLTVGLFDDIKPLSALKKLIAQMLISILALWLLIGRNGGQLNPTQFVLYVFWLLVATNALNLVDVMDGLATGIAELSFLGLFGAALVRGLSELGIVSLIFFAALLGFLPFNRYRARIFLGDAGSLMIGFSFGLIPLSFPQFMAQPGAWGILLLLFAIPLFELVFVFVMRSLAGKPFWRGSRDHFSLRLLAFGLKVPRIVLFAYMAGIGALINALVFQLLFPRTLAWLAFIVVVAGAVYIGQRLSKIEIGD